MATVFAVNEKEKADLMMTNGRIYTVDSGFTITEALAVKGEKIIALGTTRAMLDRFSSDTIIDLKGKAVYPGFVDAHSHFYGYAIGLQYINLLSCSSFEEVLSRISLHKAKVGDWIVGRGWDQNLWNPKTFPDNKALDSIYPENPVMLIRVDGHVVLANTLALRLAGMEDPESFQQGEVGFKDGKMTGILSESAADRMRKAVPDPDAEKRISLLYQAEQNCFQAGLTSVCDAGLDQPEIGFLDSLYKTGKLRIHLYVMLTPSSDNLDKVLKMGKYQTNYITVRSLKIYADGSLGSRTARLKKPYSDAEPHQGLNMISDDSLRVICNIAYNYGYQVNTHCIGDESVSRVLRIYGELLKGKNDLRWRIEHAQVVDPQDFHYFRDFSIVPSVQATHATSDMAWAGKRLGEERMRGAYAYKDLLEQNGWLPNGTDFPIEDISPLKTYYAAVFRKDAQGNPQDGFYPENALSREEALKSITIWAAKAGFLESVKGSLEIGKDADIVVLNDDIMQANEEKLPWISVIHTISRGKIVY
jgi:predicted amidohydrolase YtcJ